MNILYYVQAGVVLETLDSALADQGMMVPLDLGAKVLMYNQKPTMNMCDRRYNKLYNQICGRR